MKKAICFLLVVICCMTVVFSVQADRAPVEKDSNYIGAMRVTKCKEWVSLREGPRKTYRRIMKVPLGAIVMNCTYAKKGFVKCEYQGEEGYIMMAFLEKAPEYEPPETSAESKTMTKEEILDGAETILEWKEFNVSVIATHIKPVAGNENMEELRVGCFIDDVAAWGYIEKVENKGTTDLLKAFIGGDIDEPQVMVYDAEYGLIMIDLLSGKEKWSLLKTICDLGDAGVMAIAEDGTMYITGTVGKTPVAISRDGRVLWVSEDPGTELGYPVEIILNADDISVRYETEDNRHQILDLEYTGEIIGIRDADA